MFCRVGIDTVRIHDVFGDFDVFPNSPSDTEGEPAVAETPLRFLLHRVLTNHVLLLFCAWMQ